MRISATVRNRLGHHEARVDTNAVAQTVSLPPKSDGPGSAVNGGELLFLALATCYCNDVYREAARTGLRIDLVEVTVTGVFGGPGEPARDIRYEVRVESPESDPVVRTLLKETDRVAEIQNTLRCGVEVTLASMVVNSS